MTAIPVYRLRNLDAELAEILAEADSRCATQFTLMIDDIREKLSPSLIAITKNENRAQRRHADQDGKGNFVANDKNGGLRFSTADQQERLQDELYQIAESTVDIDIAALPVISKRQLASNGLAVSGQRIANLRPILDMSEPAEPEQHPERTIALALPPRGAGHAEQQAS